RAFIFNNMKLDDNDRTYLNGVLIGTHNGWNDERNYLIDSAIVNFTGDNVLAIQGAQGGGGAGIDQVGWAPKITIYPASLGAVMGTAYAAGTTKVGADSAPLVLASADGKTKIAANAATDGTYSFRDLVPGDYVLTSTSPAIASTAPAALAISVAGGKIAKPAEFLITYVPFFPATLDATVSDDFSKDTSKNWTSVDIGDPEPGSFAIDTASKTATVTADGADIWDGGDHFRYTYKTVSGDFSATVKVLNVPTTDGWSKAGLMVRNTLDTNSQHVFVCASRDNGEYIQARPKADAAGNGSTSAGGGTFTQGTGYYLKLVRKGQHFDAYKSLDGNVVAYIGSVDVTDAFDKAPVMFGMAVTSHSAGNLGDAKLMDLRFGQDTVTPPPPTVNLGDVTGDGKFNISDVVMALRGVAGLVNLTADQQKAADVNADKKFNITDVVLMLRKLAGLIDKFPGQA
ncbi:MAG TPA: dockerin type I repeat-containing protein, partial [Armatimonadota bacterium]